MKPNDKAPAPTMHAIPVYEVHLVKARRPLRIAETRLCHSANSARALYSLIGLTDREHFACLFADGSMRATGAHIAAIGGQHSIGNVDPRVLLRAALAACASALVIGHNHSSGDPSPSDEDIATTAKIQRAARIIGIPLLDHVIVTRDPKLYHSMSANGTMLNDIDP